MEPLLSPDSKRIYVVDALRGFAVMAIMLLHFLEHFIYNSYPVASSPVMEAANQQFKDAFFLPVCRKVLHHFRPVVRVHLCHPVPQPGPEGP